MKDIVEIIGLQKTFRDFWQRPKAAAVRGISFNVKKGEIFALLGPNGSGKSTTIKILLGLLRADAGIIKIFGKNPGDLEVKKQVGFLAEETLLYPELSAEETLIYLGKLFGLSNSECCERAKQLLEMTGLTHAKNRLVGEFSKGMARRIGIAQALINNPALIILDEPTAGLDPIGCREIKDLIKFLKNQGKTIVLTTHLLSDVEDIADFAVIIYGGIIQAKGKMQDILAIKNQRNFSLSIKDSEILLENIPVSLREKLIIKKSQNSLENFFLETVKNAGEIVKTSGAREGTMQADYLREKKLSRLVFSETEITAHELEKQHKNLVNALNKKNITEEQLSERKQQNYFSEIDKKIKKILQ